MQNPDQEVAGSVPGDGAEASPPDVYLNHELYKLVPPPNPLIAKNKYIEAAPRSHLLMR